jgi:hypothetical protein
LLVEVRFSEKDWASGLFLGASSSFKLPQLDPLFVCLEATPFENFVVLFAHKEKGKK